MVGEKKIGSFLCEKVVGLALVQHFRFFSTGFSPFRHRIPAEDERSFGMAGRSGDALDLRKKPLVQRGLIQF